MTRHDDGPLIELARTDPACAFAELYRRYNAHLTAYMTRCVGERYRAEDICQTAWAKAWSALPSYRHENRQYMAYITAVALNVWRSELRTAARRRTVVADLTEHLGEERPPGVIGAWTMAVEPSAEDRAEESADRAALARIVAALDESGSEQNREVLHLRYLRGMPIAEAARCAGLTEPAAKSALRRGRTHLARSATIRRIYSDVYGREPV